MLSTINNDTMSSVSRVGWEVVQLVTEIPEVMLNYTKSMGGVDQADQ